MSMTKLEQKLGLHQSVRIIYVVDGYQVELYGDDAETQLLATAQGPTIELALKQLEEYI